MGVVLTRPAQLLELWRWHLRLLLEPMPEPQWQPKTSGLLHQAVLIKYKQALPSTILVAVMPVSRE